MTDEDKKIMQSLFQRDGLMLSPKRNLLRFIHTFSSRELPVKFALNIYTTLISNREKHIYVVFKKNLKVLPENDIRSALNAMSDLYLCFTLLQNRYMSAEEKLLQGWRFYEELAERISQEPMTDTEKVIINGIFISEFAHANFPNDSIKAAYWQHEDIVRKYNQVWIPYEKIIENHGSVPQDKQSPSEVPSTKDTLSEIALGCFWWLAIPFVVCSVLGWMLNSCSHGV